MRPHPLIPIAPVVLCAFALVPACGDDDNQNTNDVHLSGEDLLALNQPADYTCLDATDPAQAFPTDTQVTGIVEDFEEGSAVEGIVVSVYATRADLLADAPFDQSDPTDPAGAFSVLVPGGAPRVHWKSANPLGQAYHFDTIEMEDPVAGLLPDSPSTAGKDRKVVSAATVETVPLTLGISRVAGLGVIAGTLYDCRRRHVQHAAVRIYDGPASDADRVLLSITSGQGLNTFYFASGMPSRLQEYTDPEGQFISANLAPGVTVFVEMWGRLQADQLPAGFDDCTGGCPVSSQEVPVVGDTIVITDLSPSYVQE